MRQTRHLWGGSVFDAPSAELRKTAQRVARAQTRRLQETKATTNPYHKEQYINAFLEAYSTAVVHQHVVSTSASAKHIEEAPAAALTASHELTTLAQELDARYAARGSFTMVARSGTGAVSAHNDRGPRTWRDSRVPRVEFGAWRSTSGGDTRLQRRLRSADVMRHCVIREARTPPSLSPEVIQRTLPPRLPAPAQRLIVYLTSARFQRSEGPENCDRLQLQLLEALRALHYSHELQRAVALYAVLCLGAFRDWHTASAILVSLVQQWPALVMIPCTTSSDMAKALHEDRSHMIALFMETVRCSCSRPSFRAPSLDELEKVCAALHESFEQKAACAAASFTHAGGLLGDNGEKCNGTVAASSPRWDSVVSAPLLSLMGMHRLAGDRLARSETAKMVSLAERFCVQRSRSSPSHSAAVCSAGPAYMPAVAWGEYLRALHRCGASLVELQGATDRITDKAYTRHADALLSSTHVWSAYLACSPGSHAKEVYERNLRAYRVKETPATTAAVVMALLQEGTAESRTEARALWSRLQRVHASGKMVLHTCSTLTAYIRLLEVERQADALVGLLTSFEGVYEPFGVALESFSQAVEKVRQRSSGGSAIAEGLDLLAHVCYAHPFLVPPQVRYALVQAIERTTAAAASAKAAMTGQYDSAEASLPAKRPLSAVTLEFSAEDLAELL
ncbi:hypothetical protein JIQ42_02615 [Leishmania sp. Namibia]|uniref:hypothetical protein n=1 Tax=Leishmania sp. Namibia TaxID=2802991 RepID=UPI001B3E7805|nr:hypothetical protein JIQ42_02615 [Leishmania sp. Namibia]